MSHSQRDWGFLLFFVVGSCISLRAEQPDLRKELSTLESRMKDVPPLRVTGVITVLHAEKKLQRLEKSTLAFDVMQVVERFRSSIEEVRPGDSALPRQSISCSFDGSIFRRDPWGSRANAGSREALAASETQITENSPQFATYCSFCQRLDVTRLGAVLGAGRKNLMGETSVIERLIELVDKEQCTYSRELAPDGEVLAEFDLTRTTAPDGKHVIELRFSPHTRAIHTISMYYSKNNPLASKESAEWRIEVVTSWRNLPSPDHSDFVYPATIDFSEYRSGALVFQDRTEVLSAETISLKDVSDRDFGWKSLGLSDGRMTRFSNGPSPVYKVREANGFVPLSPDASEASVVPIRAPFWRSLWWGANIIVLIGFLLIFARRWRHHGDDQCARL